MVITTIQLIYKVNIVMASVPRNQNQQENQRGDSNQQSEETGVIREGDVDYQYDPTTGEYVERPRDQRVIIEGNPVVLGVAREITKKKKTIAKLTNFTDT